MEPPRAAPGPQRPALGGTGLALGAGVGLGGALLRTIEAQAVKQADHLLLLVSDFNEAAQHFYRRLGYAQVGALPAYVMPDVAELIYYKRLRPWNS